MVMDTGWLLETRSSCFCPDLTLRCNQLHSKHSVHALTLSERIQSIAMHALCMRVGRGGHTRQKVLLKTCYYLNNNMININLRKFKDFVVYCLLLWNDVIG